MSDERFASSRSSRRIDLAAESGRAVMAEGGNAVEAMLAMAATIAVVYPHMNSLGGDGFWLIADPRRRVRVHRGLRPARARRRRSRAIARPGYDTIPSRGPLAALTVPGAVGGFALALEIARASAAACRSPDLFGDAMRHAREGFAVSGLAGSQRALRIRGAGGGAWLRRGVPHRRQAAEGGRRAAQPALADMIEHLAEPGSRISTAAMSGARSLPISPRSAAR